MLFKMPPAPTGCIVDQEIQQQSINGRVMFLITHFELGSCYDKYDFNLGDVFRQVSIHLLVKFRNWENESLASFGYPHFNVWTKTTT